MQTVSTALSTPKPASLTEAKPLPDAAMSELFSGLAAALGDKFTSFFEDVPQEDLRANWAASLSGFMRHEIQRGLAAVTEQRFPPTLGEFKHLCRPALDPEFAWLEAAAGLAARAKGQKGVWTHPAVYRAAMEMAHELRTDTFQRCRVRWKRALSASFADGWGDPVPDPVLVLEHKPIKGGPPAPEIRARIAAILGKGGGNGL